MEKDMIAGNHGYARYKDAGTMWIQGYAPIENTNGWSVGVTTQTTDFLGSFYLSLIYTVVLVSLFIVGGTIISLRFANKLSRPIAQCSQRLEKLADGDLTSPVDIQESGDEVGVLVSSTKVIVKEMGAMVADITRVLRGELYSEVTGRKTRAYG